MFAFHARGNPISIAAVCTLVCALSGCTLNPFDDDGAVRQTSRSFNLSPKPVDAPDFVRSSRPEALEYVPVGVTPPARTPLKDPKQLEQELNVQRDQAIARAAAPRPASPYDGKIEPGFKPPPQSPLPPSGPSVTAPPVREPANTASTRDRAIAGARRRAAEAAKTAAPQPDAKE